MVAKSGRAGRYVLQPAGYRAFIPAPLPPDPLIQIDAELLALFERAVLALGRLDSAAQTLPTADLFVAMYVRREAVLSSQIEGTQSTLENVLTYELEGHTPDLPQDVEEVVNYVRAMNYGLERVKTLPLSLRLIREIHRELLQGVRGAERQPGEFRTSQNWIGSAGATLSQATFVPPPVAEMHVTLDNFERFLHDDGQIRVPILCALAHAQFETIHPFLDGNGRVGRLLITFLFVQRGMLRQPLLYLSVFLKRHQAQYYDRLMAVREDGDWEGWLKFFLRGVAETAEEATETVRAIVDLRERHWSLIQERRLGVNGLKLLDLLFRRGLVSVRLVASTLEVSFPTAGTLIERFEQGGIVQEITGARRNRRYLYGEYLALFGDRPDDSHEWVPTQVTEIGP